MKERTESVKYCGQPCIAMFRLTLDTVVGCALQAIYSMFVFGILIETIGRIYMNIHVYAVIALILGLGVRIFISFIVGDWRPISWGDLEGTYNCKTTCFHFTSRYGCRKTFWGYLYFFAVLTGAALLLFLGGYELFTMKSSGENVKHAMDFVIFMAFGIGVLKDIFPRLRNFKFYSCPKCKRGLLMCSTGGVGADQVRQEARFSTVRGEKINATAHIGDTDVNYSLRMPKHRQFDGVYQTRSHTTVFHCRCCGYTDKSKEQFHSYSKRIL